MKFNVVVLLGYLLIFTVACSESQIEEQASASGDHKEMGTNDTGKGGIDSLQTVVIHDNAAVFLLPDSSGLNKLKSELSEEKFYKVAKDNHYYFSQAVQLLKEKGIKQVFPEKRYLLFKKKNGEVISLDTQELNDGWWIVIFNNEKEPLRFSPVEIYTIIDFIKGKA